MNIEIIALNGRKYSVKRVIPERYVTDTMSEMVKQLKGYDLVLRKQGNYYYVDEIEDVEWEDVVTHSATTALSGVETIS